MNIRLETPEDYREVEELTREDGIAMPAWTFGPISIHPDFKRKGYGLKLLNYSIEKAREMGIGVLCGAIFPCSGIDSVISERH